MPAERAVDGNQPVAAGLAAFHLRRARSSCEALHAQGERERSAAVASVLEAVAPLPVLVAHVAMAQVGDPCAADLSQAGEGRAVAADPEREVHQVPGALERRAVMGRGETDQLAQMEQPALA